MQNVYLKLKDMGYSDEQIQEEFNRRGLDFQPSQRSTQQPTLDTGSTQQSQQIQTTQDPLNLNSTYNKLAEQGFSDKDIV